MCYSYQNLLLLKKLKPKNSSKKLHKESFKIRRTVKNLTTNTQPELTSELLPTVSSASTSTSAVIPIPLFRGSVKLAEQHRGGICSAGRDVFVYAAQLQMSASD
jgi:hypothetical protein